MCKSIFLLWRVVKSIPTKYVLLSLVFIAWFSSASALAADDEYLKALEAEAKKSAPVNTKKTQKDNTKINSILKKKEFIEFEKELQFSRPATYRFYEKLDDKEKTVIYSVYKKDHKLTKASKTVFDIYFEKNK